MHVRFLSLTLAAMLLISCGSGDNSTVTSSASSDNGKAQPVNCLKQSDYNYAMILTGEKVKALYSLEGQKLKINEITGQGEYNSLYYQWPSDRAGQASGLGVDFPDKNFIGIGAAQSFDEKMPVKDIKSSFHQQYKKLSDASVADMEANIDKAQAGASQQTKATSKQMIAARKEMGFEPILDGAQEAYWRFSEKNGGELVVLHGNEKFSVYVKVSMDPKENLELAKKVAAEVTKSCS